VFFRKHAFVRDGLLSIALAFAWSAGIQLLCKRPEGIICDFSRFLLDGISQPARDIISDLIQLVLRAVGLSVPAAGSATTDRRIDVIAFGIGIPLFLLYWFLIGGTVCRLWRFVRSRIQNVFARTGSPS
jgi:hypothetical protein